MDCTSPPTRPVFYHHDQLPGILGGETSTVSTPAVSPPLPLFHLPDAGSVPPPPPFCHGLDCPIYTVSPEEGPARRGGAHCAIPAVRRPALIKPTPPTHPLSLQGGRQRRWFRAAALPARELRFHRREEHVVLAGREARLPPPLPLHKWGQLRPRRRHVSYNLLQAVFLDLVQRAGRCLCSVALSRPPQWSLLACSLQGGGGPSVLPGHRCKDDFTI